MSLLDVHLYLLSSHVGTKTFIWEYKGYILVILFLLECGDFGVEGSIKIEACNLKNFG